MTEENPIAGRRIPRKHKKMSMISVKKTNDQSLRGTLWRETSSFIQFFLRLRLSIGGINNPKLLDIACNLQTGSKGCL
jgi:hypothetical protein